jgi:hypothetical protein
VNGIANRLTRVSLLLTIFQPFLESFEEIILKGFELSGILTQINKF